MTPRCAGNCKNEKGVALVTVLMIVAAMSAAAVGLSAAVLSSTSRAKALDASAQADWLVFGAEEFARLRVTEMATAVEGRLTADMPGLGSPLQFRIEGGLLTVTGRDASNCFNLNSLRQAGRTPSRQGSGDEESPQQDFAELVRLSGLEDVDPETLAASLADWMDRDQTPRMNGAEDSYYVSAPRHYRTSSQPLAELGELRAVRGFTGATVEALRQLVCLRDETVTQKLNINTLTQREAALLSFAMSGALPLEQAQDVLFQRPPGGWESVEAFLTVPAIAGISPDLRRMDLLTIQSSHIDVDAAIEYRGTRRVVDILFELDGSTSARTVYRQRKG